VLGETVGDFQAVIPEVEANAYICGVVAPMVNQREPLINGFLVR
jgi:trans-L-3-hydroxyproline dehydratase